MRNVLRLLILFLLFGLLETASPPNAAADGCTVAQNEQCSYECHQLGIAMGHGPRYCNQGSISYCNSNSCWECSCFCDIGDDFYYDTIC
jgi:hypothetical protein